MIKDIDDVETMLLMLMDRGGAHNVQHGRNSAKGPHERKTGKYMEVSVLERTGLPIRHPTSSYTVDISRSDRIYADTSEYLKQHTFDVIGSGVEAAFLQNGHVAWVGVYPTSQKPARMCAAGKVDKWFEYHYRDGSAESGWDNYIRCPIAFNKHGNPVPKKIEGQSGPMTAQEAILAIMACSVKEDAHRIDTVLAAVSEGAEILFPSDDVFYKDFFKLRDAPRNTPSGKLNPIVHLVSSHIRRQKAGKAVKVRPHTRGVEQITIDGMSVKLTPNFQL